MKLFSLHRQKIHIFNFHLPCMLMANCQGVFSCRFQSLPCRDLMPHHQFGISYQGQTTVMDIQTQPLERGSPHWSHGIMREMKLL